jgi:hypothetical protein
MRAAGVRQRGRGRGVRTIGPQRGVQRHAGGHEAADDALRRGVARRAAGAAQWRAQGGSGGAATGLRAQRAEGKAVPVRGKQGAVCAWPARPTASCSSSSSRSRACSSQRRLNASFCSSATSLRRNSICGGGRGQPGLVGVRPAAQTPSRLRAETLALHAAHPSFAATRRCILGLLGRCKEIRLALPLAACRCLLGLAAALAAAAAHGSCWALPRLRAAVDLGAAPRGADPAPSLAASLVGGRADRSAMRCPQTPRTRGARRQGLNPLRWMCWRVSGGLRTSRSRIDLPAPAPAPQPHTQLTVPPGLPLLGRRSREVHVVRQGRDVEQSACHTAGAHPGARVAPGCGPARPARRPSCRSRAARCPASLSPAPWRPAARWAAGWGGWARRRQPRGRWRPAWP